MNTTALRSLPRRHACVQALSWLALSGASVKAWAQSWPSKPLKLIVPFPAGGATDVLARVLAEKLPQKLGQSVIVENKPGAGTVIGVTAVTKAPADGYTILVSAGSSFAVLPALKPNLAYDIEKDLATVNLSVTTPLVIVTSAALPYKRLSDLIAHGKERPKSLRYTSYGAGTSPHLATELFTSVANIQAEAIPYKGSSDALLALLRGDADFGMETIVAAMPHIKSGKLRALAVTMPGRSQYLPDVPGLEEFKLSAASFLGYYGVAVATGTPAPIIDKLSQAIHEILKAPETQDKLTTQSLDVASKGPEEMRTFIRADMLKLRELGKRLNVQLE